MDKNTQRLTIFLIVSVIIYIILEITLLSKILPGISKVISTETGIILLGVTINIPQFGVIIPLVLTLISLLIYYLTIRKKRHQQILKQSINDWLYTSILVISLPIFLIIGAFVYILIESYLPSFVTGIVESFGISQTIYIFEHELLDLDGSLSSLLGLAFGIYYLIKNAR